MTRARDVSKFVVTSGTTANRPSSALPGAGGSGIVIVRYTRAQVGG